MSDFDKGLLPVLDRLRARWPLVAWSCAIAVGLALLVSLLLPKQYTATTRIVIEPPAGSDPRASVAVSPIYLESLRGYELYASSDSLFLQAVEKFGLRRGSMPIDALKKSVLKAEMPRNMKILEIAATLPDPRKAHELAQYIADETVKLNRSGSRDADQELVADAEKQSSDIRARLRTVQEDSAKAQVETPIEQLKAELESDEELRAALQRGLAESEVLGDPDRIGGYRRQLETLQRAVGAKRKLLAERSARIEKLSFERAAAEAAAKSAETRLQEARAAQGYRGERLRIIDPGVVPERPSFPNLVLNGSIALFAALVLSLLYLAIEVSYAEQRAESNRRSIRVAGRHD